MSENGNGANGNGQNGHNPDENPVEMRPGKHGGMLRTGGTNRGGPGRPASEIRAKVRGSFDERVAILDVATLQHEHELSVAQNRY